MNHLWMHSCRTWKNSHIRASESTEPQWLLPECLIQNRGQLPRLEAGKTVLQSWLLSARFSLLLQGIPQSYATQASRIGIIFCSSALDLIWSRSDYLCNCDILLATVCIHFTYRNCAYSFIHFVRTNNWKLGTENSKWIQIWLATEQDILSV